MDYLSNCRICFSVDIRLRSIIDTHLQEIYETLTLVPLVKKDHRPVHACSECCTRLENCYQLRQSCLRSEELFTQLLSSQVQLTRVKSDPDADSMLRETPQLLDRVEVKLEVTEDDTADPLGDVDSDGQCSRLSDGARAEFNPAIVKTADVRDDVRNTERETEVQEVIVVPSPYTTHTVEEGSYQNLTSGNTNSAVDDNNVNEISSIGITNSSKGTKQFSCDTCQKRFTNNYQLTTHVRTHTGEKPYKCSYCMKCFSQKSNLMQHIRTHTGNKPYKCNYCSKSFSNKTNFMVHIRTHTGEKPYKCSHCMKCFSQQIILNKHIRTHTREKPYTCSDCMKSFSVKSNLMTHIRTHTGIYNKPYKCSDCIKSFSTKGALMTHIRTHTGEKPYKCSYCMKCFTQKIGLISHICTHTGDKPYKCSDCMKCFSKKYTLMRHVRMHTGEKPFKCYDCMKCFSDKRSIVRHTCTH